MHTHPSFLQSCTNETNLQLISFYREIRSHLWQADLYLSLPLLPFLGNIIPSVSLLIQSISLICIQESILSSLLRNLCSVSLPPTESTAHSQQPPSHLSFLQYVVFFSYQIIFSFPFATKLSKIPFFPCSLFSWASERCWWKTMFYTKVKLTKQSNYMSMFQIQNTAILQMPIDSPEFSKMCATTHLFLERPMCSFQKGQIPA